MVTRVRRFREPAGHRPVRRRLRYRGRDRCGIASAAMSKKPRRAARLSALFDGGAFAVGLEFSDRFGVDQHAAVDFEPEAAEVGNGGLDRGARAVGDDA